jgi:type II restriction/modification system DNA methylase subunit YeeA
LKSIDSIFENHQRLHLFINTFLITTNYTFKETVSKHLENHKSCKVLAPSCGSGIFLVEVLRKIIEKKRGFRRKN